MEGKASIKVNRNLENKDNKIIEKYEIYKKNKLNALTIGDSVWDAIYVIDNNGVIVDVNKNFAELLGMAKCKLLLKNIKVIWNEKIYIDEETYVVNEQQNKMPSMVIISGTKQKRLTEKKPKAIGLMVLEEKKEVSIITRIARKHRTATIRGIPIFDEYGEIIYVITVIRDITELAELTEKLEKLEQSEKLYIDELNYLRKNQFETDFIGNTAGMERIKNVIEQVAKTDVTVLISGETGVGKEVVAREIYKNSRRKNGPYIKVNCAAIPEGLLEAELFGYEKGSFTGAQYKDKLGLFEVANNGTILLDEIGEMPVSLQSKLLRVLQEKEFTRIGGTNTIKVNVRVIAATNQNLLEQIKKGVFRQDLYYRLNVFPIKLIPLRERKEDISILALYFLERFNKKYYKNKILEENAIEALEYYDWPGNVRELQNIIERTVVIDDKPVIIRSDIISALGKEVRFSGIIDNDNITLKEAVNLLEKNIIEKALKKYGSTYKAASALGINQSTVVKKAKALGIKNSDENNH